MNRGTGTRGADPLSWLPTLVVGLVVRVYPEGHPRRAELVAELACVRGVAERWSWLGGTVATAFGEGWSARGRVAHSHSRRAPERRVKLLMDAIAAGLAAVASVMLYAAKDGWLTMVQLAVVVLAVCASFNIVLRQVQLVVAVVVADTHVALRQTYAGTWRVLSRRRS